MTSKLKAWERPHYAPGGGEPFLFYVIYGNIENSAPLSRQQYRSLGVPSGIKLSSYGPSKHPEVPSSFCQGYLWDEFENQAPNLATQVEGCDQCLILQGTPEEFATLNYLRDTVGLITYLLDQGGCAVYDPLMFRWWSAADWKEHLFVPAAPVPRHHAVILVSDEANSSLKWFHTRGMRKFGRPDISVRHVPLEYEEGIIDLCNRLIEHMAFGHIVPEGQKINMKSLPGGGIIQHGGDLDDPDFNNVHIEVKLNI